MDTREILKKKIADLEAELEPLEEELRQLDLAEIKECQDKVERTFQRKDKFTEDELVFAAFSRCDCGAGLAYPSKIGPLGSWVCSDILLGAPDIIKKHHTSELPFAFYDIKSENQPSVHGATTRKKL